MSQLIFINNNDRKVAIAAEAISMVVLDREGVTVHLIGGNSLGFRSAAEESSKLYKFILDEMAGAGANAGGTHNAP